jgi:hypothetical protein
VHKVLRAEHRPNGVVVVREVGTPVDRDPYTACYFPISRIVGRLAAGVRAAVRIAVSRELEADIEPC